MGGARPSNFIFVSVRNCPQKERERDQTENAFVEKEESY